MAKRQQQQRQRIEKRHLPKVLGYPLLPLCKTPIENYGYEDSSKRACGLKQIAAKSREGKNACVVFSIGSYNEFSFEQSIFNETSCTVHTFDCTLGRRGVVVPEGLRSRVFGHNVCIGARDEVLDNRVFKSWRSIIELTKLDAAPTFLKLDVEGLVFIIN